MLKMSIRHKRINKHKQEVKVKSNLNMFKMLRKGIKICKSIGNLTIFQCGLDESLTLPFLKLFVIT
jgi:hypothetical protein